MSLSTSKFEPYRERYVAPDVYGIFEREPRICAIPDSIVFGPYATPALADNARYRYGYDYDDNYYVAKLDTKTGRVKL